MLLAGALGFAIIAQVRQTSIEGLETLREDELVRIFAGVDRDGDRLSDEISELESSLERLRGQSTNEEEAQRSAQQRLEALGILAGTAPAQGPGIVMTVRDPEGQVTAPMVLDAIQELRDAGAEAIQVGDVRVVADTWFTQADEGLSVSGTVVRPPYVIRAIGDGNTLAGAMEIPGGVTATVRRAGGETDIQIRDEVEVDALLTLEPRLSTLAPYRPRPRDRPCAVPPRSDMSDLDYPAGLRYTAEHEWVRADGETLRVGITSFAQEALGDVVYVSLPAVGDTVAAGDTCGEVESTKSVSDLYAPVSGEVTAINGALDATPELVNSDPYGEGWMYEIRPADAGAADALLDVDAYTSQLS